LVFGIPFVYLFTLRKNRIGRTVGVITLLWATASILRTGSRAGLLELGILGLFVFFRLDGINKLKFLGVFCAAVLAAIPFVTTGAAQRWMTLLGSPSSLLEAKLESDEAIDEAYLSALESSEARLRMFNDSVRLTLEKPLTGVGPGNFASASSDPSRLRNRKAAWADTHNAYTKVSSECGLPGLALFLAALICSWRIAWKLYRRARGRPGTEEIANQAYSLMMALSLFAFNGLVDSNAYLYYFPVLAGLTFAFQQSADLALATPLPAPPVANPVAAAESTDLPQPVPNEPPPIASTAPWLQPGPRTRTHPKFCR
jgi:O-antigen ligase